MSGIDVQGHLARGQVEGDRMLYRIASAAAIGCGAVLFGVLTTIGTSYLDGMALVVFPSIFLAIFGIGILLIQPNPLRIMGNMILLLLPLLGLLVPPRRFGGNLFDLLCLVTVVVLPVMLISRQNSRQNSVNLKPVWWILVPFVTVLPSVVLGIDWYNSLQSWLGIVLAYCGFLAILNANDDVQSWYTKITGTAAIAAVIVAAGILFEHFTRINLSFSTINHNATSQLGVYRAAGFFQDAQKAAQFLGCLLTFFIALLSRQVLVKGTLRLAVIIGTVSAVIGLIPTASRSGLLSGIAFSAFAFIVANRFTASFRILLIAVVISVAWIVVAAGDGLLNLLPSTVAYRLADSSSGFTDRVQIWQESWHIFLHNPLAGIGPSNYQEVMMQEKPLLRLLRSVSGVHIPDQPESGYLKILYESGLFGVIGTVLFVIGFLLSAWRGAAREPERSYVIAAVLSMCSFGVSFVTLFTVSDPRNLMIVLVMSAIVHRAAITSRPRENA